MEEIHSESLTPSPFTHNFTEEQVTTKDTKIVNGLKVRKVSRDYIVEVPHANATVLIIFTEILRARQSFEAVVTVQLLHNTEGAMPAFQQRLDLNSASAVSNLSTALNSAYGNKKDGYNWVLILNRAGIAIKQTLQEEKKPTVYSATDAYENSTYLVEHFLEHGSATLIHGDGSTGKSYLCLYMAVCGALERDFFGKKTEHFKTLYIDHEATAAKLKNRLHRVANGLEVTFTSLIEHIHWYKPDGSLANEQEIIARMIEDNGYKAIIVDAGASASGGSPMDEQAVLKLFNALDHLPCAKLVIHHEPKDPQAADDKAYYGTTFWRNAPRLAWRLKREAKDGNKSIIKATHHKANDDGEAAPFTYSMDFPITQNPSVLFEITDDFEPTDDAKIIDYLIQGEADIKGVLDATDLPRSSLQRRLGDLVTEGKIGQKRDGKKLVYYVPPGQIGQ
jgi:hypothetical protein